jgi:hypothetical protein
MPQIEGRHAVDVGQPLLTASAKIHLGHQFEQALIGAIGDRDRRTDKC